MTEFYRAQYSFAFDSENWSLLKKQVREFIAKHPFDHKGWTLEN